MVKSYYLPLVLGSKSNNQVDYDLLLALVFWFLEADREKGGGLLKKKKSERITHLTLLHRPILIKDHAGAAQAFDCCGISETRIDYGIAPSLTRILFYLISDNWAARPESYAEGLNSYSVEFEGTQEKYHYLIKGWITDSTTLDELSRLLKFGIESDPIQNSLPQPIDSQKASIALSNLDKIKIVLQGEIMPLIRINQKINEKTNTVLKPLHEECAKIEDKYNKEIDRIRPSVLESKEKIEHNRLKQQQIIHDRFNGRLHDLQNKLDAAKAKIDAYDPYSGREPQGGIDKQYSIRDSARRRIMELREQRENEIATIDEKYDSMIEEQEKRITSIEERMHRDLAQPKRQIAAVLHSTNRLSQSVDGLINSHKSVISKGTISGLTIPSQIAESEFMIYLPFIVAAFNDGAKKRTKSFSFCTLKEGKGALGVIKDLVGMKFMPLEPMSGPLANFMAPITPHPSLQGILSVLIRRHDLLRDSTVKNQVFSGIDKMRRKGWIKENEAKEFLKTIDEFFTANSQDMLDEKIDNVSPSMSNFEPMPIQLVRFVNYEGGETELEIDKLESLRKDDLEHFYQKAPSLVESSSKSRSILVFLENLMFPYSKAQCISLGENWVQQMLYMQLSNSQFKDDVLRERAFNVGETGAIGARIDFDVAGVGIEVKIFRSIQDSDRLVREMLMYKEKYQEIIIPYINAGAMSNERLLEVLDLLQKQYPQIKGYLPLRCKE